MKSTKFLSATAYLYLVSYFVTLWFAIAGGAGQPETFTAQQDVGITFFSLRALWVLTELLGIYCIYLALFGFGNNQSSEVNAFIPWKNIRHTGITSRALSTLALLCGAFLMILPLVWWNQIEESRELLQLLNKYSN